MEATVEELLGEVSPPTPVRFYNERPPNQIIQTERPEHYAIVSLYLRGLTQREIAQETTYSEAQVSQILRQDWAKDRIYKLLAEHGGNVIQEALRLEVLPSITVLAEIRDNPDAPAAARVSACDNLLNRFLGKPTQRTEVYDGGKLPTLADKEELDRKLEEARQEVARLENRQPSVS